MDYFAKKKPDLISSQFSSLYTNLSKYCDVKLKDVEPKYTLDSFIYPNELMEWFNELKTTRTLVLESASGYGKTQGIITLLKHHGYKILRITDINNLKDIRTEHSALILDDLDWTDIKNVTKISLFDKDSFNNIRILYSTVMLNPNLLKIVLTNNIEPILGEWDLTKN